MLKPGNEQRKPAAIMFTDMGGYSALAQHGKKLALALQETAHGLLADFRLGAIAPERT